MATRRLFSLDGFALGFAGVGALCAAAVVTDGAPPLADAIGAAVYPLLFGWALLTWHLIVRRRWLRWVVRVGGWSLLLAGITVAADWAGNSFGESLAGAGGAVGAWLASWLEDSLTGAGPWLVVVGIMALGAFLAIDYVTLPLVRTLGRVLVGSFGLIRMRRLSESSPALPAPVARTVAAPSQVDKHIPIIRPTAEKAGDVAVETLRVNVPAPTRPPLRIVRPGPVSDEDRFVAYQLPSLSLLEDPQPFPYEEHDQHLRDQAALLEKTFQDFELNVRVVGINTGPVITQYEIALETGLRVNKVTCLADDLALNLKVPSVRMVAPIPGKNTVGVEIPNEHRAIVRLKEVLLGAGKKVARAKIPLFLGKDTEGRPLMYDLAEMPHLLIAGRTGTGKSVCLNAIILSMLMTRRPDELKLILIDPKRTELIEYGRLPHLMHPVVTDAKKAEAILAWAVDKMEQRYDLLSRARVRSIAAYNELSADEIYRRLQPVDEEERARIPTRMPYVVLIVDELGDLMMQMKREIEGHIIRLAQKSRAAGIHLIVATQKPTVDVITGLIKSNLPARICFQVSSRSDSRVVLDEMGADKLLGKGDMLFLQPGTSTLVRAQGAFASDHEITRVVEDLDCEPCFAPELLNLDTSADEAGGLRETLRSRDALYEQAVAVVVREGRGSVSLLQRALGIGYGRAARLIDFMAEDGIVGAYNGSNAREVLYTPEQWSQARQSVAS
jgi:S-DNA-T family DNA segregation ATPase FtsK/SpoIIIE